MGKKSQKPTNQPNQHHLKPRTRVHNCCLPHSAGEQEELFSAQVTLYGLVALLFVADSTSAKRDKAKKNVSHDNSMAVGVFLFPKQIQL